MAKYSLNIDPCTQALDIPVEGVTSLSEAGGRSSVAIEDAVFMAPRGYDQLGAGAGTEMTHRMYGAGAGDEVMVMMMMMIVIVMMMMVVKMIDEEIYRGKNNADNDQIKLSMQLHQKRGGVQQLEMFIDLLCSLLHIFP